MDGGDGSMSSSRTIRRSRLRAGALRATTGVGARRLGASVVFAAAFWGREASAVTVDFRAVFFFDAVTRRRSAAFFGAAFFGAAAFLDALLVTAVVLRARAFGAARFRPRLFEAPARLVLLRAERARAALEPLARLATVFRRLLAALRFAITFPFVDRNPDAVRYLDSFR